MSSLLTKSKYLIGLQCSKYLWIQANEPDNIPQPDIVSQHIFDQGELVSNLAKKLYPDGIDIPTEDFMENIEQTKQLISKRKILFEAGILINNLYSRIDILNPRNYEKWDIIEVKSSTSIKDIHIQDVSFQKYCCEKMGLKIGKCFLIYINNQYIKNGDIIPEKFFSIQDISDQVSNISQGIQERISSMLKVIDEPECPDVRIGPYCQDPYSCPIIECWNFLPDDSVFTLYNGGRKSFDLLNENILSIKEIPQSYKLNEKQLIQKASEISGKPHIDKAKIFEFLSDLKYPLYYLDFETISPAVPLFDGTRPYQNIPFQYSIHVQETDEGNLRHLSFLAEGREDPRPALLVKLHDAIGDKGNIIVYNQSFEKSILIELGNAFPCYKPWIENTVNRLTDLLSPFRSFYYYHPLQKGSISIKNVLPALTGKNYESEKINKGDMASISFMNITYGDVPGKIRLRVLKELEEYCCLDTEAMALIVNKLRQIVQL